MTTSSAVEDELLTDSDLSDDEARVVELKPEELRPATPRPSYTDEELNQLMEYVQRMTILQTLDQRDWNEQALDTIRRWLEVDISEPLLSIYYEGNTLSATLGLPPVPVQDLSYFLRATHNEIFTVDGFHDEVHFGTLHSDVDSCLLHLLERLYAPSFQSFKAWNATVRERFCVSLNKFLTLLTCMNSKLAGMAVLHVPYVHHELDAPDSLVCDRALVSKLERVAVYWATQLRTLLGDSNLVAPNELATIQDEYEFWEYRFEVLQGLNSQLAQLDVQRLLQVLRQWNSVHMPQLDALVKAAQLEQALAWDNLKYLQLLLEPCARIEQVASPADVSALMPKILHVLRFIWQHSSYYKIGERITGLFSKLSNQLIKYCTQKLQLESILKDCRPRFGLEMCQLSLDCCLAYKEHVLRMQCGWPLNQGIVFNHVVAFMERLRSLLDICESMIVYGRLDEQQAIAAPSFGGTQGAQLEQLAASVEQQYMANLDQLRAGAQQLLNVHSGAWYAQLASYRGHMQRLEQTQEQLLLQVFRAVCNVEEQLEALNVLYYYSYSARLRKTYLRQVSKLWTLFGQDMDVTARQLLQQRPQHESWLSRALSCRNSLERLSWLRQRLHSCHISWLPPVPEASVQLAKFELLHAEFERELRLAYMQWQGVYNTRKMGQANQQLEQYLLLRVKGLLQCQLDLGLLSSCSQAQHFEHLGFGIPLPLRKIYERHELLLLIYNSLLQLCLSYNSILCHLSPRERKLFKPLITQCDRQLAPALFRHTFAAVLECQDNYQLWLQDALLEIEQLRLSVQLYKRANRQIALHCEQICDTRLLDFNFSGAVDIAVFEQQLSNWLSRASKSLRQHYNNIVELMLAVSWEFDEFKDELCSEWPQYVNVFDDMLGSAFLCCMRTSLMLLLAALRLDEHMAPAPVLVTESDVREGQIVLTPDMESIADVLLGIIDRMYSLVDQLPRLGYKLKLPKEQQRSGFAKVFREDAECLQLVRGIELELDTQRSDIEQYVQHWQQHQALWQLSEETFTQRLMTSAKTARIFEASIEQYSALADEICFVNAIAHVHFVLINQNAIKSTLLDWIEKWQALNIKLLLQHATYLMQSIYRYMQRNERKVLQVPRTLRESLLAKQLYERLLLDLPLMQQRCVPMMELFVLLHKYHVGMSDETQQQVIELESSWLHYLQTLAEAEELLDTEETEDHKQLLLQHAEKFKQLLKQFHEDFYSKLPKK
ncbi:CG9068 [Drosophila busckii]|uniref:CG9068 n=1 Tax=Drosophila busckii TaxID=30019 RepID=A0A0M4E0F8_DROBS|nr:dynein-1-beta heavy chain, flagellar inner arm I1 complex [Drosophila busckii]ALC38591.1 CG9068 [Drosophila busckii]